MIMVLRHTQPQTLYSHLFMKDHHSYAELKELHLKHKLFFFFPVWH